MELKRPADQDKSFILSQLDRIRSFDRTTDPIDPAHIDAYGGTCIACALEEARRMLYCQPNKWGMYSNDCMNQVPVETISHAEKRYVVLETDGVPTAYQYLPGQADRIDRHCGYATSNSEDIKRDKYTGLTQEAIVEADILRHLGTTILTIGFGSYTRDGSPSGQACVDPPIDAYNPCDSPEVPYTDSSGRSDLRWVPVPTIAPNFLRRIANAVLPDELPFINPWFESLSAAQRQEAYTKCGPNYTERADSLRPPGDTVMNDGTEIMCSCLPRDQTNSYENGLSFLAGSNSELIGAMNDVIKEILKRKRLIE